MEEGGRAGQKGHRIKVNALFSDLTEIRPRNEDALVGCPVTACTNARAACPMFFSGVSYQQGNLWINLVLK